MRQFARFIRIAEPDDVGEHASPAKPSYSETKISDIYIIGSGALCLLLAMVSILGTALRMRHWKQFQNGHFSFSTGRRHRARQTCLLMS